jgi:FkbM family methyltransferase
MRALIQSSVRVVPWRLRTAIKRVPLIAPLQRYLLARFVEGREFVHTVDAGPARGLVYPIVLPDDKGVWTGTYELDFVEAMAAAVSVGDVCFDVGGWRGFCGGTMALRGARRVVIFEPLPENCQRIGRMIGLNPGLAIELVEAAAGGACGTAQFAIMPATSMGKLADSEFQADATSGQRMTVDVVALDAWCERTATRRPNVIKIDVEGAEMQVLQGATQILKTNKPKLFIEAHSRELAASVVALLSEFGYAVKTLETGRAPDGASEPEVCHLVAT